MRVLTLLRACMALILTTLAGTGAAQAADAAASPPTGRAHASGQHASIHGLRMHYEIRGAGRALVLLHGAVANTEASFAGIRPALEKRWRTIGVDQQGHGGTADIDRPLGYHQMAEDTAALLGSLGITNADFVGWSDGGRIALEIAIRHPALVNRMALIGTSYTKKGEYDWLIESLKTSKPADWPAVVRDIYARTAVQPDRFGVVAAKLTNMWLGFEGWRPEELRSIKAPTLIIIGDGDSVRPEHAVEMFRLLPHGALAVLPMTDHLAPITRADWIVPMLETFLGAPATPPASASPGSSAPAPAR
jgi:pimeloyl-ACP methyl ester carboxylesterase